MELPTTLKFRAAFLSVFQCVVDDGYKMLNEPIDSYADADAEDYKTDLNNAISETLAELGVGEPAGDDLSWLGEIHDWIEDTFPWHAEASERFCTGS